MRSSFRRLAQSFSSVLVAGALLALAGCETKRDVPKVAPKDEEKSPTANILPEPLASGADRERNEKAQRGVVGGRKKRRESLQTERALVPASPTKNAGQVWTFSLELPALRSLERGAPLVIEGAISVGTEEEPTRQTLRLTSDDFPLPRGSELRSSAETLGWLLVWPDGRSYRTVPEGALLGLFEERRVDVMPRYDANISAKDTAPKGKYIVKEIESSVGRLELSLVVMPDLGDAGHLLCDVFMEFLRARRDPELCGLGEFPAKARYQWSGGGEFSFSIGTPKRRNEGPLAEFRMPPELPIWKPGEVPPGGSESLARGTPIVVNNQYDVPLFFESGGHVSWVAARSAVSGVSSDGADFAARDFLGRINVRGSVKGEVLALGTPESGF